MSNKAVNLERIIQQISRKTADVFGDNPDVLRVAGIILTTLNIGIFIILALGIVAYFRGNMVLASADFIACTLLLILNIYFCLSKNINTTALIGVFLTAIFYFILLVHGGINNTAFVWYYTFPLYSCFVLGPRNGFLASTVLALASFIFFTVDSNFPQLAQYSFDLKLRFLISYAIVTVFSLISEYFRVRSRENLKTAFQTLEQKVEERTLELKRKNAELEIISSTDTLTGLFNRMKLDEILRYEVHQMGRYEKHFSIILLDIDHFKMVNDAYGHPVGDAVLIEFAQIIKKDIRLTDSLGRWGGEEFLLICPATSKENAFLLAEKIRLRIADHTFEKIGSMTSSFGVVCSETGDTEQTLLKKADDALYLAKKTRNRTIAI